MKMFALAILSLVVMAGCATQKETAPATTQPATTQPSEDRMGKSMGRTGTASTIWNVTDNGVALKGYDAIAYFTEHRAVMGDPTHAATYEGATYYFSSAAHRAMFVKSPEKYAPAFGGYCAYGASKNKLVDVDPTAWQIVNGRLILQFNHSVKERFARDATGLMSKADANWPGLVAKHGG